MIALPAGNPPYAIVPRLTVPGARKARLSPDLGRFESSNAQLIRSMLVTPLSDEQIRDTFDFQHKFYVVDRDFPSLRGQFSPAQASLAASVDKFSMPSKNDIDALYHKDGLSLPAIVKFAYAFEAAIKHRNDAAIVYFDLQDGNPLDPPEPMVVPTFRTAIPELLKQVRAAAGITEKELISKLTAKYGRQLRPDLFTQFLERPFAAGRVGGRSGSYLISEGFASAIYEILESRKDTAIFPSKREFPTINCLFENDVPDMPGNGLYCQVLPLRYGHQLR